MNLVASQPAEIRVLSTRQDGSGGVVELPVLVETDTLDLSKTAGGGGGSVSITRSHLQELADNFNNYPGPVPIGASPHLEFGERGGPSAGFVEGLRVAGGSLMAQLDLGPELFAEVVTRRAFRGFSVEMHRDLALPTRSFEGWVLTGGVFTNRPSLDVTFRMAAAAEAASLNRPIGQQTGDTGMANNTADSVTLEFHHTELGKLKDENVAIKAEFDALKSRAESAQTALETSRKESEQASLALSTAKDEAATSLAKVNRLDAELRNVKQANQTLTATLTEQTETLHAEQGKNLSIEVERIVDAAVGAGVPPAIFDGYKDNPAEWMQSKYASLEAFKSLVDTLSLNSRDLVTDPAPSGKAPTKSTGELQISASDAARLERLGLDPKYISVQKESQLPKE